MKKGYGVEREFPEPMKCLMENKNQKEEISKPGTRHIMGYAVASTSLIQETRVEFPAQPQLL